MSKPVRYDVRPKPLPLGLTTPCLTVRVTRLAGARARMLARPHRSLPELLLAAAAAGHENEYESCRYEL